MQCVPNYDHHISSDGFLPSIDCDAFFNTDAFEDVGIAYKVWIAGIVRKRCEPSKKLGTARGP